MAWLSGWGNRIELKIEDYANAIGAEVIWFPATIHLKNANGDSTKVFLEVGANYRKIAITKADGVTELKGEIENWSYDAGTPTNSVAKIHTSKTGWVINANTSIFLYYDNEHANNDNINVIGTAAGFAVWNDGYRTVHHKKDDTTSTVLDSTSNGNNGTKKAANEPLEVVSGVGKAQHYDGLDDYVELADDSFESDSLGTIEAIINRDTASRDFDIVFGSSVLTAKNMLTMSVHEVSGWNLTFQHYINGVHNDVIYGDIILGAVDRHVAVTSNGTAWALYVDGVADAINIITGSNTGDWFAELAAGTHKVRIGSWTNSEETKTMDGIIGEFRYSSVVRSPEWIKGTSNTLLDALFTYGSEEKKFEYVGTGSLTYSGVAEQSYTCNFIYVASGNFVTSGSGICYYEKPDWEYTGSGELAYSGEAIQSHTKDFLYDTSGNFVFSGTGIYSIGFAFMGGGSFTYSGEAIQTYTFSYLYSGRGVLAFSGDAIYVFEKYLYMLIRKIGVSFSAGNFISTIELEG